MSPTPAPPDDDGLSPAARADLERRLRALPLAPLPPALEARLRLLARAVVAARAAPRPWRRLARAAAAILVFLAGWQAFAGAAPAQAFAGPALEAPEAHSRRLAEGLAAQVDAHVPDPARGLGALGTGALLLGVGLVLAARPTPPARPASPPGAPR